MSSETAVARSTLAPYCVGIGIDFGFGGDAIVPHAITFDLPQMYCPSFCGHRQVLQGDCTSLPFICSGAFDWVYSSHLLEDFSYRELVGVINEWRRILTPGGVLITNCPDQQKFLAHCEATGQSINANHKENDFSLHNFRSRVLALAGDGDWQYLYENPDAKPYSWYLVARKI